MDIFKYVKEKNVKKVEQLLKISGKPKRMDFRYGLLSLALAAEPNNEEKIKTIGLYINAGMKPEPLNSEGLSLFDIALRNKDLIMLELLIKYQMGLL